MKTARILRNKHRVSAWTCDSVATFPAMGSTCADGSASVHLDVSGTAASGGIAVKLDGDERSGQAQLLPLETYYGEPSVNEGHRRDQRVLRSNSATVYALKAARHAAVCGEVRLPTQSSSSDQTPLTA